MFDPIVTEWVSGGVQCKLKTEWIEGETRGQQQARHDDFLAFLQNPDNFPPDPE